MWDWICAIFAWFFIDILAEIFFFWRRDEDRTSLVWILQIIVILSVLAAIAGLVYWLFMR